jgi:hypothetical protein
MIESVVLHPDATPDFSAKVASLCKESGMPTPKKSTMKSTDI